MYPSELEGWRQKIARAMVPKRAEMSEEHICEIIVSTKKMILLLRAKSFCFVEKFFGLYSLHPPCTTALFVVQIYR